MDKTITVSEKNWNKLWDLKRSLKKKSIDEVITEILSRDKQEVKS